VKQIQAELKGMLLEESYNVIGGRKCYKGDWIKRPIQVVV
jgi:hypothetical protein